MKIEEGGQRSADPCPLPQTPSPNPFRPQKEAGEGRALKALPSPAYVRGLGGGKGPQVPSLPPTLPQFYSARTTGAIPLFSLMAAWAAAMRAMGMRMGEQDT
jgi:hypothetical protein